MTSKKQTTQAMRPPGTSLMKALYSEHVTGAISGYTCSECGMETRRWKYCPGCGRKIARFAEDPERKLRRLAAMFWNRER